MPDATTTLNPSLGSIQLEPILSGFQHPIFVGTPASDPNTMYVAEQTGRIWTATKTANGWQKGQQVTDLSAELISYEDPVCSSTEFNDERGLLGLAFAPDFATSDEAYVTYTRNAPCDSLDRGEMVLSEIHLGGSAGIGERVLMSIDKPTGTDGHPRPNHQGGGLVFGPDGMLYIGLGEGGRGGGPLAESLNSQWGKLLRINPADPDGSGPLTYSVPPDNPYVNTAGDLPEIWASGLRNPWRWSFDTNGDLWIGDVGQYRYESVYVAPADGSGLNAAKGFDYGWSRCEGAHVYDGSQPGQSEPPPCTVGDLPLYEYEHTDGRCAVIGGYVYRGQAAPAWDGTYFFSDFCDGVVRAISGTQVIAGPQMNGALTFGELPDGTLLVTSGDGTVNQVVLAGSPS